MKQKKTVIFDLDGTLLDTLDDLKNSVNHAMRIVHLEKKSLAEVRSFVGNGIVRLIEQCVPGGQSNPKFQNALSFFKEHYMVHCNDCTKPYDGIMEVLKLLKEKGYGLAIVSNKADPAVKELNEIYFRDLIEVAIGENEAAGIRKKPAPDTVFAALEALGSKVEDAVYVGDSEVDIETAKQAGMDLIACSWGFRDRDVLLDLGVENLADQPMEILDLLEG